MQNDLMSIVKQELMKCKRNLTVDYEDYNFKFKLVSFMESNRWFNTNPSIEYDDNKNPLIMLNEYDATIISDAIKKWLYVYDSNREDQYKKLIQLINGEYKITSLKLNRYFECFEVGLIHRIEIAEYLLFKLKFEITDYSNELLDGFIDDLCKDKTLTLGMIVCDFLEWLIDDCNTSYTNKYKLSSRSAGRINTNAYDSDTYLKLIYYLFNDEYLEENNTVRRIATSSKSANAFLYLSLHFVCGLRDSDIKLLPRPMIECEPRDILESLRNDTFSNEDSRKIVNSVEFQVHNLSYKPLKTSNYSGISDLKFFVPESCRDIIGKYYAAAEAHMQLSKNDLNKPLINVVTDPYDLGEAMGEEFFELFLYENFSSRRANKAYLQALEAFANNLSSNISAPKGYILASLARSHKGSYGEFADTTEIYLKDSQLTGLSPEFVAKELFERGVCSFLAHMLLMMLESNDYSKLPVPKQTLMIKKLGMIPNEIENIVNVIEEKRLESIKIIDEILNSDVKNVRHSILEILHNIGSESAASKTKESLCLLTAMNKVCLEPERKHCIGCKYEIKTKTLLYNLISEFKRLKTQINEAKDENTKVKNEAILRNIVLPAIEEILQNTRISYGIEYMNELEDLVRRYST